MLEPDVLKAIQVADRIEAAFRTDPKGPVTHLIAKAATAAIDATKALLDIDPTDARGVMLLQNQVHRYRDMIEWLRTAVEEGDEAYHELSEEERHELLRALNLENDA